MMMTKGLRRAEMKDEGVIAASIWPRVTEKSSVVRIMRSWYPALSEAFWKPGR